MLVASEFDYTVENVAFDAEREIEAARGAKAEVVDELYKRALRADATNCSALWVLGRERADRLVDRFLKEPY